MKVAHNRDYDTHAVIGGKEIEEFGISTSAEFFHILSDTMYTNKPLAVIREVLCNAWDAHIVSGRTSLPVEITINEDKLIIRDHGYGIPHDKIHSIYCVYGNSTKENDGNQTGGFGLGSKAPFAYSDHFTVSNHHGGLKTVHAISKGSARTQGKPDRRIMVSIPTQEQGVEVMVPIKQKSDIAMFVKIVKEVAGFGEMNVLLNGEKVETTPISLAENNMFLTTSRPGQGINKLNVRYGNVVYPIPPHAEYIGLYNKLVETIKEIPAKRDYDYAENEFALIMQAPPNSISVTPSRESLSLTETTIETLKGLFKAMISHMSTNTGLFEELLLKENEKAINYLFRTGYSNRIMFSQNLIADDKAEFNESQSYRLDDHQITNMIQLASYYLRYKKKFNKRLEKKIRLQRVEAMLKGGYRRPTDLLKYLRIFDTNYGQANVETLFSKRIIQPLLKKLSKVPLVNPKHLYVLKPYHHSLRAGWLSAAKFKPDNDEQLPLLMGYVIITHNRIAVQDRFWEVMPRLLRNQLPNGQEPKLVYVAPRTKGVKEAAIAEFQRLGYWVIDFAEAYDAYTYKEPAEREVKLNSISVRAPKPIGLPLLSNNLNISKHYQNFSPNAHLMDIAVRGDQYEYVIKPVSLSGKGHHNIKFFPWGDRYAEDIVSLFGSKIGVCVSEPQLESQMKKGKKDALSFIAETISKEVLTNVGIRTYVENNLGEQAAYGHFGQLLAMSQYSEAIRRGLNMPKVQTEYDLKYYNIFQFMVSRIYMSSTYDDGSWEKFIQETQKVISGWKAPQHYLDLAAKAKKSEALTMLDLDDMSRKLRDMARNPKTLNIKMKTFIEISLLNALNI